ncbi:MAG: signal peptidase I, partial [Actinomycetota bacterium]|nr:signal peptidase I [Actinomycetota bacterium]
ATGTPSSLVQSGSALTITLGNASGTGNTVSSPTKMVWTPSASATDRAGNACSTTAVNESGGNDVEF